MTADTGRSRSEVPAAGADGQNPTLVRALKIAVTVMGVMIVAGLAAVIWRIVDLASSPKAANEATPAARATAHPASATGPPATAWPADLDVELPEGAIVRTTALSGNRLALHYEHAGSTGIAILDLETGRTLTRVRVKPVRGGPAQ